MTLKNALCCTFHILKVSPLCTCHLSVNVWLTLCECGVWVLWHAPICCASTFPLDSFFLTLSFPLVCVWLCLRSISPVFHAHLLIRISTGREDPHSLDRSRGNRLQEVHLCQRRLELRHRHVGSYVVWRAAVLGHEQSRCKITREFMLIYKKPPSSSIYVEEPFFFSPHIHPQLQLLLALVSVNNQSHFFLLYPRFL